MCICVHVCSCLYVSVHRLPIHVAVYVCVCVCVCVCARTCAESRDVSSEAICLLHTYRFNWLAYPPYLSCPVL
jgi:hypothetical protein